MTIISAEKIIKKYGNSAILKDIDFNINSGEFIGIMGKSGSGKSTLLKILGLMEHKSAGNLYFKENNIEELSEEQLSKIRRDEFGFVFQEFFLMDSLNVLENVLLPILIGRTNAINEEKKALQLEYLQMNLRVIWTLNQGRL